MRRSLPPLLLLLPLIAGCGAPGSSNPLGWRLDDGRTLAAWVEGLEAAAVLVMSPDECLACYTVLGPWLRERARHEGRMFLLFTRPLDDTERRTLLAAGIRADGVIRRGGPRPGDTPVELVFRRGRPVYHALRVSGASPLLDRLEESTLEQFVAAPPVATADPQPAYDLDRRRRP